MLSLLLVFSFHLGAARSVVLAWDPNPEPDVAGYRLHRGTSTGSYDRVIEVGNATTNHVADLQEGTTCFFAVMAYSGSGLESGFSNGISYTPPTGFLADPPLPPAPAIVGLVHGSYGVVITWASEPGESYRVLYKNRADDPQWIDVSGDLAATGPKTTWADTDAQEAHQRFYTIALLGP